MTSIPPEPQYRQSIVLAFWQISDTLAMLNIEPPEPKNSGSNADDPINLAHLLAMLHIVDLIC
jgi:hypothetical protein